MGTSVNEQQLCRAKLSQTSAVLSSEVSIVFQEIVSKYNISGPGKAVS